MKTFFAIAALTGSLLGAAQPASAAPYGPHAQPYAAHQMAPTRAAAGHRNPVQHRRVSHRNQCVRVGGRITLRERACLSNRHYTNKAHYHAQRHAPGHGHVQAAIIAVGHH